MASILDKYGIKEVADVVFYELDSEGAPSAPVLYLDTLKVSTVEQSAETVDATGGKGNVKLLTWDTNKEITLTLEDALFSAKSLGIMFGGKMTDNGVRQEVLKTLTNEDVKTVGTGGQSTDGYWKFSLKNEDYTVSKTRCSYFIYEEGKTDPTPVASSGTIATSAFDFVTFDLLDCTKATAAGLAVERSAKTDIGTQTDNGIISKGIEIDITSNFDSNTYYITGDTYARNYKSGKDEFLQFIVPKGKVSAEDVSLTMEADGDPATFSMTVNCLKDSKGSMIKLVKYAIGSAASGDSLNKGAASVLDLYNDAGDKENAGYSTNPAASVASNSLMDDKSAEDLKA